MSIATRRKALGALDTEAGTWSTGASYTRRGAFHVKHEPYKPTRTARLSATRYRGKVCEKHPEANGERHVRTFLCCECAREKKRDYRAGRMLNKLWDEAQQAPDSRETSTEVVDPLSDPTLGSES